MYSIERLGVDDEHESAFARLRERFAALPATPRVELMIP